MIAASLASGTFVGRREELGLIFDEFELARAGQARLLCVEGEAGIGKSRLLKEFETRVGEVASVVFAGAAEQIRTPYLPFMSLLSHLGFPRPSARDKAAFFETTAARLTRAAQRRPLVAVIEDLQWADSATLELLTYLASELGRVQVLLVATLRPENAGALPPLAAFRNHLSRQRIRSISLGGLRRNDVRSMVRTMLVDRGGELAIEAMGQIEALSEGNPLYVEELVRVALDSGRLDLATHAPLSLQATIAEGLSQLNDAERDLLVRAAIVGPRFSATFLSTIAERPHLEVLEALQRAVSCGIVLSEPGSLDDFRFRHAMIRQTLADRLILGLAAPLHLRIARELESTEDAASLAAELAYHWSEARDAAKARYYNELAAEQARGVYAYRDAIAFYSAALRWEYPDGPARASLCERLGTMLYVEGCGEEPSIWFEKSREQYERLGDASGTANALLKLADQYWVDARTRESLSAASEAARLLEGSDDRTSLARAYLSLARFCATLGDAGAARSHLARCETLEDTFDLVMRSSYHEIRAETQAAAGNFQDALRDCEAAAAHARHTGDSETIAQVENNFALVAADIGELEAAIGRHENALREARRTRMLWRVAYCALNYAQTRALRGELEAARRLVWEALECSVTTQTFQTKVATVGIPLALRLNDRALLEACTYDKAVESARASGELQRIGGVYAAFAELPAARGARSESLALLREALARLSHDHRCWPVLAATARTGDPSDARNARTVLDAGRGRPALLRARRALLFAYETRIAQPERSKRAARAAARAFERFGFVLDRAAALEAAGERDAAAAAYRASGSLSDLARLDRTGAPAEQVRELSPRQLEIAHLVAQGETNKGIAATLHISEHTVEHHLSAIFERLGVRTRASLAAKIASR